MSTLQVDRIEPYQSASVTIVGLDVDTTALNNFTASQEVINTNLELATASLETSVSNLNGFTASQETLNSGFATTGSNTFAASQTVTGDITATRLFINGGGGTDATITGSMRVTANIQSRGTSYYGTLGNGTLELTDSGFTNGIGMRATGISGVTVPSIFGFDTNFDYVPYIQIQNGPEYTDGTISVLKPMDISGSVAITEVISLTGQDPLPAGAIGDLAVSGSLLYFYDGAWKAVSLV